MPALRLRARRSSVAGALLAIAIALLPHPVRATETSFEVSDQAVVQVIGRAATITIRTWNKNTVEIQWPDGAGFTALKGVQATRPSFLIPTVNVQEQLAPGSTTLRTLLPEDFPVPNLVPGMHDVVRIVETVRPADLGKDLTPAELTVMVPESTGLLNVRSGRSAVTLNDYHGTTILAVGRGRVIFNNVSGDAFVQPLNGRFYAHESTFERLRIRSNRADEVFDGCRVKQIEATTLTGNIIFDNGIFDPGLAQFESDRGSIALGVHGGAQLAAHTQDGRVLTVLPATPNAPVLGRDENANMHDAGSGGPLVNASSQHGNIFLYDGSLTDRRAAELNAVWQSMYRLLSITRRIARGERGPFAPPPQQLRRPELRAPHRPLQ